MPGACTDTTSLLRLPSSSCIPRSPCCHPAATASPTTLTTPPVNKQRGLLPAIARKWQAMTIETAQQNRAMCTESPGSLAMAACLSAKTVMYKRGTPGHPCGSRFFPSGHGHWHSEQSPCGPHDITPHVPTSPVKESAKAVEKARLSVASTAARQHSPTAHTDQWLQMC